MTGIGHLEREARWALNGARGHWRGHKAQQHARRQPAGIVHRNNSYTVTKAAFTLPWGGGVTAKSRLAHMVRDVYIAWPRPHITLRRPFGLAVWWCGAGCFDFELTDEPARKVCELCRFARARHERNAS